MRLFRNVGVPGVRRSMFNLSHERKFTANLGELIPCFIEDCMPGDVWRMSNEMVLRMMPTFAPILHQVNIFTHYFFVPYRLLWEDWEEFITGGEDGQFITDIPLWKPTLVNGIPECRIGTPWDYMGFQTSNDISIFNDDNSPVIFPLRAMNMIYNEYYRDQNLRPEIPLDHRINRCYRRAWRKDYFTSALPWQQRGISPGIPIDGVGNLDFSLVPTYDSRIIPLNGIGINSTNEGTVHAATTVSPSANINPIWLSGTGPISNEQWHLGLNRRNLERGVVNFDGGTGGIDILNLRLAIRVQRWMELNARTGVRYSEFLRSHYGVFPRDERLDRPEFIGGTRSPLIISEVLQTSRTEDQPNSTPQGNLAGHGMAVGRNRIGTYRVKEHGLIMGLFSIMPQPTYHQGIERMWLHRDKFDYPFPLFAHLSERPIYSKEIFIDGTPADNQTFGFQGMYDEYRHRRSTVHGHMRPGQILDYWTLTRHFQTRPQLNQTFIQGHETFDSIQARVLAWPEGTFCVVNYGNICHALRPIPKVSIPGYVDHF